MAIKPKNVDAEADMDMTPMIDIVFQLLIFFILVTELQKMELAPVALPKADQAKPDIKPDLGRTVINVTEKGTIIVGGSHLSLDRLSRILKAEAELFKTAKDGKPVLIRADKKAEYGVVQEIMAVCVKHEIWKLSFGAAPPEK